MNNSVDNQAVSTDQSNQMDPYRTIAPWVFALLILLGYIVFMWFLVKYSDTEKTNQWTRLLHLLSSVEAIVFTAVGFIFGREVSRARANNAEKRETQANTQAEKEKKDKQKLAVTVIKQLNTAPAVRSRSADGPVIDAQFDPLVSMAEQMLTE